MEMQRGNDNENTDMKKDDKKDVELCGGRENSGRNEHGKENCDWKETDKTNGEVTDGKQSNDCEKKIGKKDAEVIDGKESSDKKNMDEKANRMESIDCKRSACEKLDSKDTVMRDRKESSNNTFWKEESCRSPNNVDNEGDVDDDDVVIEEFHTFEDLLEVVGTRGLWNIIVLVMCTYG